MTVVVTPSSVLLEMKSILCAPLSYEMDDGKSVADIELAYRQLCEHVRAIRRGRDEFEKGFTAQTVMD